MSYAYKQRRKRDQLRARAAITSMTEQEFRIQAIVRNFFDNLLDRHQDTVEGQDVHRLLASKLFHVTVDQVTTEQRSFAKSRAYSYLYGKPASHNKKSGFGALGRNPLDRPGIYHG